MEEVEIDMRIGVSLFFIAVGAVLKFAVTKQVNGIDIPTVGVILMVVGAIGLLLTLIMMGTRRRTDVIRRSDGGTTLLAPRADVDPLDPRY